MPVNPSIRAALLALPLVCCGAAAAQQATPPTPATQDQGTDAPAPPHGKVLFEHRDPSPFTDSQPAESPSVTSSQPAGVSSSAHQPRTLKRRVAGDNPNDGTEQPAVFSAEDVQQAGEPVITAADRAATGQVTAAQRLAVRITASDLDLHLDNHTGEIEARAQLRVRNGGAEPITLVPLRISGALQWESARLAGGAPLKLEQHHLADDLDHTGVANELEVTLPQALAPGAEIALDLYYSGTLAQSDERLLALGAPPSRAEATDWDTVTDTFTGLRGLGNVLWYPVAGVPALLTDGDAVPKSVEKSRADSVFETSHLRLTVQFSGAAPDAAFFCGERAVFKPLGAAGSSAVVAEWNRQALGLHTPSLFVVDSAPQTVAGGLLRVVTDHADTAAALGEAAARLKPMMSEWLGASPLRPLDVVDLGVPGAAGFADGSLLVAPLTSGTAASLAPGLVQPLAAAWLPQDISAPWLRDGIPAFLQAVWAERTTGREAALSGLSATQRALVAQTAPPVSAISSSADDGPANAGPTGPALAVCADAACTRGKAPYVLEMLRGMLGDGGLAQAISGWSVQREAAGPQTAAEETASFEKMLQQVAGKKDLGWFFSSWIDQNRGLPELAIVTVAPRRVERAAKRGDFLPPKKLAYGGPIGAEPVPLAGDPDDVADRTAIGVTPGDKVAPVEGSWLVAVEVQNNGGADAEVPVTVRAGSLTNTLQLHVPAHGRATVRVPFEADPQEVLVNDGSVPEARVSVHRRSLGAMPR